MESKYIALYKSPIGDIEIRTTDTQVTAVNFAEDVVPSESLPEIALKCISQLDEYFNGNRKVFDLDYAVKGTKFQEAVWESLVKIDFGKTASYKDIAIMVNNPKGVRAVGGANHNNPISIIIPCHRVIGADGKLVGYGGGIERKVWLLEHEKNNK